MPGLAGVVSSECFTFATCGKLGSGLAWRCTGNHGVVEVLLSSSKMISILDVSQNPTKVFHFGIQIVFFCRQRVSCLAALPGRSFETVAATWQDGVGMHMESKNPGKIIKTY